MRLYLAKFFPDLVPTLNGYMTECVLNEYRPVTYFYQFTLNEYRPLTYFYPPLTHFYPPIISSISNDFALSKKYVVFWYTNLQLTAENSPYLMWLKSLCSWVKMRQRGVKIRQATVAQNHSTHTLIKIF